MDLYELDKAFEEFLEKFPEAKKQLVEDGGERLYQKVIDNIESSVHKKTGNLKEGVTKVVGSGGGYAAVRPNWGKAPHTHLIENGRKIVKKDGEVDFIPGKHMYRNALNALANELEQSAEEMADKLVGEIFG